MKFDLIKKEASGTKRIRAISDGHHFFLDLVLGWHDNGFVRGARFWPKLARGTVLILDLYVLIPTLKKEGDRVSVKRRCHEVSRGVNSWLVFQFLPAHRGEGPPS